MADIKAVYEQQFLPARDAEWLAGYAAAVEWARSADITWRICRIYCGVLEIVTKRSRSSMAAATARPILPDEIHAAARVQALADGRCGISTLRN